MVKKVGVIIFYTSAFTEQLYLSFNSLVRYLFRLYIRKFDLKLSKKLVKYYIWSIAFYGAETWMFRAVDQKHRSSFEMWYWRRMEKISWTNHVRKDVLRRVKEQRNILYEISKGKLTGLVTLCVEIAFYNRLLKER